MILGWSLTEIAQMVPVRCTTWPPELEIEKPHQDFFSESNYQIFMKLDRNNPYVVLNQNCSNGSGPLHNMAARAKIRKTFKQLLLRDQGPDFNET